MKIRFVWWWHRKVEDTRRWIAWKLPKSIVYWAFVRMAVDGEDGAPDPGIVAVMKKHNSWAK